MRCVNWLAILILSFAPLNFAQNEQKDQQTPPAPGTAPSAQEQSRPQEQATPDMKAPTPNGNAPSNSPSGSRFLPSGAEILAALDTPLSTRTAQVGDRFTATVAAPVKDSSGNIVVAPGAKLNGQVSGDTDQMLASAIKDMGHLDLRFTDIQLSDGADVPLDATLLSVHNGRPGQNLNPHEHPTAGANGVFGPPLKGFSVGNLAGGGYVLSINGKQVDLPAESGFRLRVDRDTPLP
jgi:hypothetical protein